MLNVPPKVSIIIPVYNGSNYLAQAIDSALSQTYQNIEILVINDGSDDAGATESIARAYGDKIQYYDKPNGGVASALNLGIEKMTGHYFSWLSHDDLYLCNKIQLQMDTLSKINNPRIILYGDYSVFTTDPQKDILCKMKGVFPSHFRHWITFENRLHGCTLLIPRIAFTECGLFNEKLRTTQDYDLWFRMAEQFSFLHLPAHLVKSRSHISQDSVRMKDVALRESNYLLSTFLTKLSITEIEQASYCSISLGYAQLASSMWSRGFFSAARTAVYLSLINSFSVPLKEVFIAQCILMKGFLLHYAIKPFRKIIPSYVRLRIKYTLRLFLFFLKKKYEKDFLFNKLKKMDLAEKFSIVYKENLFGGHLSRSGEGSNLSQTATIRETIPKLLEELNIHSILDAPCGDWYWMKEINLNIKKYIGIDIVNALIKKNQALYSKENIHFECVNLVKDPLPKTDLIFCRDCLVHLSYEDAIAIINNFKSSGAKYLLITTFVNRDRNDDLDQGFWRPLNMQLPPFYFSPPLKIINEGCTEKDNAFNDKSLGLWKLADLPDLYPFCDVNVSNNTGSEETLPVA